MLRNIHQLILIENSPIAALNRTFAFAQVFGHAKAIPEAEKLNFVENNYYHELLGFLYAATNTAKAIDHYEQAIKLTKSISETKTLRKEIERLGKLSID